MGQCNQRNPRRITRFCRGAACGRWPPRARLSVSRERRWTALRRPAVGSRAVGKRKTLAEIDPGSACTDHEHSPLRIKKDIDGSTGMNRFCTAGAILRPAPKSKPALGAAQNSVTRGSNRFASNLRVAMMEDFSDLRLIRSVVDGALLWILAVLVFTLIVWPALRRTCANCGEELPAWRLPTNRKQALFGGWTCPNCHRELDSRGRPIAST